MGTNVFLLQCSIYLQVFIIDFISLSYNIFHIIHKLADVTLEFSGGQKGISMAVGNTGNSTWLCWIRLQM